MKQLSEQQSLRYCRHVLIPAIDFEGQEKLLNSKVLLIGLGGLGCSCTPFLASSGIGQLTLVDFDTVEVTNLQRQILHTEADVGKSKVDSAKASLKAINSECDIQTINEKLNFDQLQTLIEKHDIVVDCTDNLSTREMINSACFSTKTPLISGAAIRMEGQITSFTMTDNSPCYHCFSHRFGEQSLSCVESGIFAPLVGIIGSFQALETLKILMNVGNPLEGKILMVDAMTSQTQEFKFGKVKGCKVCDNK
ncbi:molybdopterin-synthase adenylyltransferase MoeB [Pseudoalteromonas denitrificans]|uniref:Molybdopterin-synthase adenylyltransferase n=1 Tax=Pseudoalteromonas denitrificans DSM 6059 TaxID=1123010 RepID=A0A1I1H0Z7_9GAMM|nr:molybdopterin-synthase adenylyltransferase MoeB [Pseudoalteromonas denitrificans]SFC17202.1 [molybdopterin synthase] sulfurylase [Pseudoalteromonas denitrificans DSM 6059]